MTEPIRFPEPVVPGALPGDRCGNPECLTLLPPQMVNGRHQACVCCGWREETA